MDVGEQMQVHERATTKAPEHSDSEGCTSPPSIPRRGSNQSRQKFGARFRTATAKGALLDLDHPFR
jgi:hypothetical protein